MNGFRGDHAVVLGASMGGMLAARVLADSYRRVAIVERDALPNEPAARRGVPQGRQPHVLLARCSQILDELFPGFLDDLAGQGVPVWDDGDMSRVWNEFGGHRMARTGTMPDPSSFAFYCPSRPLLEWNVRRRVAAIPNVTLLQGHNVVGLTSTAGRERVTGVRVADSDEQTLTADVVVDATGRGSRTPVFLEQLGYDRPLEDELMVRLAYASQPMRLPAGALPENFLAVFPEPGRLTTFGCVGYENNTWMVCVGGMAGVEPPSTRADMIAYAAPFAPAHALAAVAAAEPLGEVAQYRVPSNRWRRYDKMHRFPQGLLVLGDAMCSFNPIYGQGMTIAAIEALVLRDCLSRGADDLSRRYFRATAKKVRVAWQTAVGADLALPEVDGHRPMSMRITNAYLDWVSTAAESDPLVAGRLMRVTGMVDPPSRLLRPGLLAHVAMAHLGRWFQAPTADQNHDAVPVTVTTW